MKKILKKHWSVGILFLFGLFLVFFRSAGSLDGDEAIYAQVAKETLAHDSWLTLYWRGETWLEKPPFFLWLEMLIITCGGYSEVALRFPAGLFGILTVVLVYFITYDFFKNKKGAFMAGMILFSLPLFVNSMRFAMMDTMATFFVTLAIFSIYKGVYYDKRWLRFFGLATGCAIMTKSVVGVIPLFPLFFLLNVVSRNKRVEIGRELFFGGIILAFIVVPWHAYMSFAFGMQFWQDYFGYHVIDRIGENIIASPYSNYGEATLNRFGIWFVVFIMLLFVGKDFVARHKNQVAFFFFSAVFIILIFSIADTIVPHYILPAVPFLAVIIGGIIGDKFARKKRSTLVISTIALCNFMPLLVLQASDYGGSTIAMPRLTGYFFQFNLNTFHVIVICISFLLTGLFFYRKYSDKVVSIAFCVLVCMNVFIPFYPDRSPQMKDVGEFITNLNDTKLTHVFMSESRHYQINTLLFYLPLHTKTERIRFPKDPLLEKVKNNSLCVILRGKQMPQGLGRSLYEFPAGAVYECVN